MLKRPGPMLLAAIAIAVGLALLLVSSAEAAKSRKSKKRVAYPASHSMSFRHSGTVRSWGHNLVPAGPLYNGPDYLGTDPDPNIRSQILRDLTGRYGGID
jgi:hypothetical protein